MKASKPWALLFTVIALFVTATVAVAAEGDEDALTEDDTVFNFGYDSENQIFVWGSSTDAILDCRLAAGAYQVKYVSLDGRFWVDDMLTDSAEPVTFPVRDDAEAEPVAYAADGDCALSGGVVSGPNGQVNHGMFMKLFNSMYDGKARGCLVRHLAQSGLGKGDQQVRVPEVGDEVLTAPESGTVDLESIVTQCAQKSDDGGNGRPDHAGKGKPDHAGKGKPPWAGKPGGPKSGD